MAESLKVDETVSFFQATVNCTKEEAESFLADSQGNPEAAFETYFSISSLSKDKRAALNSVKEIAGVPFRAALDLCNCCDFSVERALEKSFGVSDAPDSILPAHISEVCDATGCTEAEARSLLERSGTVSGAISLKFDSISSVVYSAVSPWSQYTLSQGRSACTAIALSAVELLLSVQPNDEECAQEVLRQAVSEGVSRYSCVAGEVEHQSAFDVWSRCDWAKVLEVAGDPSVTPALRILQGSPSSLGDQFGKEVKELLARADKLCSAECPFLGAVITRSMESISIAMPSRSATTRNFFVLDSHPRNQLQLDGASLVCLDTMESLLQRLRLIFPSSSDPSLPPELRAMYESFEITPFILKAVSKPEDDDAMAVEAPAEVVEENVE